METPFDLSWTTVLGAIAVLVLGKVLLGVFASRAAEVAKTRGGVRFAQNARRGQTLKGVLVSVGNVALGIVVAIMFLDAIGVNTTALLASVGVVGLALGFGAQTLVKDFISGILILVEGQYNIGDEVKIGSAEGEVVRVTMRSTVLRNEEGHTFYIANGSVNNVINLSQSRMQAEGVEQPVPEEGVEGDEEEV